MVKGSTKGGEIKVFNLEDSTDASIFDDPFMNHDDILDFELDPTKKIKTGFMTQDSSSVAGTIPTQTPDLIDDVENDFDFSLLPRLNSKTSTSV